MYSEDTITVLSNRIGFGLPLESGFSIELDEANSVGTTGRTVKTFHSLVTVENIFASLPTFDSDADEKFNAYLEDMRLQATKDIMPLILDKNAQYDIDTNYDAIIIRNAVLFDDAIGYKIAMMGLELFMTTKESNLPERNAKLSMANLKVELYGYKNDYGHTVATGLTHLFSDAISKASKKLFPIKPTVQSGEPW